MHSNGPTIVTFDLLLAKNPGEYLTDAYRLFASQNDYLPARNLTVF